MDADDIRNLSLNDLGDLADALTEMATALDLGGAYPDRVDADDICEAVLNLVQERDDLRESLTDAERRADELAEQVDELTTD